MPEDNIQNEHVLLHRIAESDELAFKQLFSTYSRVILPFLTKLVKSEAVAEELMQDTFIKVWLNRDMLPEIKNPQAWIYRIASNTAYSWMRKMAVEENAIPEQKIHIEEITIQQNFELKEISIAVQHAIKKMPAQRRKIYQLSREAGMKPSEIAMELNISVSTVKNTLVVAIKFIREFLVQSGYRLLLFWLFLKIL